MLSCSTLSRFKAKLTTPAAANMFWLSLDKLLRVLIGLVVGVWVARYLGPSQWGKINYVVAVIAVMVAIANLGMDGFLVKEILERPSQKHEILGTAFAMRIMMIIACFLFGLVYFYSSSDSSTLLPIFLLLSSNICIVPLDLIDIEFQSKLQSKLTVASKNIAYVIGGALKIFCISQEKSIFWFAAIMGLETGLAYFFLLYNYQKVTDIFNWKLSKPLVLDFFRTGWPFIVSNLAIILYMRVDQIMLLNLSGSYELGLFSSSARVTEMFTFIPMALASSYMPALVHAHKISESEFLQKIEYFFQWMTRISIVIAVTVSLSSSFIIHMLYGDGFEQADKILSIQVWALIPVFLGVVSSNYLIIKNLQKYRSYRTLLGLIINVLLNLLLIPEYGAIGAAIATLVSHFISGIASNLLFVPTRLLFFNQVRSLVSLYKFSN